VTPERKGPLGPALSRLTGQRPDGHEETGVELVVRDPFPAGAKIHSEEEALGPVVPLTVVSGGPDHQGPGAHLQHLARVLAELAAMHPRLPVIYAGNRKLANEWTARYFRAVLSRRESPELELPLQVGRAYDPEPRGAGVDAMVREAVLGLMPRAFLMAELAERFPDVPPARLRRILNQLRIEGRVVCIGRGPSARWRTLGE